MATTLTRVLMRIRPQNHIIRFSLHFAFQKMSLDSSDSHCKLCSKELDRATSASACVVCEAEHTSWVHQRCFDRAIDKAIRVRSSKSTSFEVGFPSLHWFVLFNLSFLTTHVFNQNIAKSPTHFFKTQKCPHPDCVKWLAEYTVEAATNSTSSTSDNQESAKVVLKSSLLEDDEEDEEENR
jgi:hypothetical protein